MAFLLELIFQIVAELVLGVILSTAIGATLFGAAIGGLLGYLLHGGTAALAAGIGCGLAGYGLHRRFGD